jgi:hypothetical protein
MFYTAVINNTLQTARSCYMTRQPAGTSYLEAPYPRVVQHLQDAGPLVRLLVQRSSNEVRRRL